MELFKIRVSGLDMFVGASDISEAIHKVINKINEDNTIRTEDSEFSPKHISSAERVVATRYFE